MDDIWKDIPDLSGYQANADGYIRSLTRKVQCSRGLRTATGRVLKGFISKPTGYLQVAIFRHRYSVHFLIASTWCEGWFDGAVIDHVNGDRQDNRAANLEWVTMSENVHRGYLLGRVNPFLGRFSGEHPTSKAVVATDMKTGKERTYLSAMDAVREGFDSSSISRCCNGENRFHKGFYWRFCNMTETKGGYLDEARAA